MTEAHRPAPATPAAVAARAAIWHVVSNGGAGADDLAAVHALLVDVDARLGVRVRWHPGDGAQRLPAVAEAAARAAREDGGLLVAVGGDGTVSAVARAALAHDVPLGVIPHGTFNFFAREHGLPEEPGEAVRALLRGGERRVQVGYAGERAFLVNASLGLYPEVLEERERDKARFGRHRLVALASGVATALSRRRRLWLALEQGGVKRELTAATLFVGNNALQLAPLGLPGAAETGRGRLLALAVPPLPALGMLRLMWQAARGRLAQTGEVLDVALRELVVRPRRLHGRRLKLALDGEIEFARTPIAFRAAPGALRLAGVPTPDA